MLPSYYNKTWAVFLMHDCPNLFILGLKYPCFSKQITMIRSELKVTYTDPLLYPQIETEKQIIKTVYY